MKFFKKFFIYFFIVLFSGVLSLIYEIPTAAAKLNKDPDNPFFYLGEEEKTAPPARDFSIQENNDTDKAIIKWKLRRTDFSRVEPGLMYKGIKIKSGPNNSVVECLIGEGNLPQSRDMGIKVCGDAKVYRESHNIREEKGIYDWVNKNGKYKDYPEEISFEFADNTYSLSEVSNFTIMIQIIYYEAGLGNSYASKVVQARYSGTPNPETGSNLGTAYSDDNIEKYKQLKLSQFPAGTDGITDTHRQMFSQMMDAMKNTGDGWARQTIKRIQESPAEDPRFMGGIKSDGSWASLPLSNADYSQLKQQYYDRYDGSPAEFEEVINEIKAAQLDFWNNEISYSCADLQNKLAASSEWIGTYGYITGVIAGGAAALTMNPTVIATSAVAGYAVGDGIEKIVRLDQTDVAEKKLLGLVKTVVSGIYKLNYMLYKDIHIGLTGYETQKESFSKERGLTPQKVKLINNAIDRYKTSLDECIKNIEELINKFKDFTNEDTCNVSNTGVIGGLLARGLCAILKLIGEIAKFITNVLFTSVFNAYIGGANVFG